MSGVVRRGLLAAALLSACVAAMPALADEHDQLKFLVEDVNIARGLQVQRKAPPVTSMPLVITTLTSLIDGKRLSESDTAAAFYYRAEARRLINDVHREKHEPIDAVLTWDALADYDRVIARGADILEWDVRVSETEYGAGTVAYTAGVKDRAYSYWTKCAALGQAGCMNVVANAKLTGDGDQAVDIPGALELHAKVFATGTRYLCAGAYSALSIARIMELTGVKRSGDDSIVWMNRAHQLFDDFATKYRNPNMCGRATVEIDEFLVHLGHHERRDDLLRIVLGRPIDDVNKSVVRFMLGESEEGTTRAVLAVASLSALQCEPHLHLLWFLELSGKHEADRADLAYLKDHKPCAADYALAQKFKSAS